MYVRFYLGLSNVFNNIGVYEQQKEASIAFANFGAAHKLVSHFQLSSIHPSSVSPSLLPSSFLPYPSLLPSFTLFSCLLSHSLPSPSITMILFVRSIAEEGDKLVSRVGPVSYYFIFYYCLLCRCLRIYAHS